MFCSTVKSCTSMKCWCTMPRPRLRALVEVSIRTGLPLSKISPEVGCSRPYMMFIRVDLPAPFSPTMAWISPRRTSKLMSSLATMAGNTLVMCFSSMILSVFNVFHLPCKAGFRRGRRGRAAFSCWRSRGRGPALPCARPQRARAGSRSGTAKGCPLTVPLVKIIYLSVQPS